MNEKIALSIDKSFHDLLGKFITKKFIVGRTKKPFIGQVMKVAHFEIVYQVIYEDGDADEMSGAEIMDCLCESGTVLNAKQDKCSTAIMELQSQSHQSTANCAEVSITKKTKEIVNVKQRAKNVKVKPIDDIKSKTVLKQYGRRHSVNSLSNSIAKRDDHSIDLANDFSHIAEPSPKLAPKRSHNTPTTSIRKSSFASVEPECEYPATCTGTSPPGYSDPLDEQDVWVNRYISDFYFGDKFYGLIINFKNNLYEVVYENGGTDKLSRDTVEVLLETSRVPFKQSLLCMTHHVAHQQQLKAVVGTSGKRKKF